MGVKNELFPLKCIWLLLHCLALPRWQVIESDPGQSLVDHHIQDGHLTISLSHDEHIKSDQMNTNETNRAQFLRLQNFTADVVTKHRDQPYEKPPLNRKETTLQNRHGRLQRVYSTERAGRQSQLNDLIEIEIETGTANQ
jgi:hypothetical protein